MTRTRRILKILSTLDRPRTVKQQAKQYHVSVRQMQRDMRLLSEFRLVESDSPGPGYAKKWQKIGE